jgi:hypothetical protein
VHTYPSERALTRLHAVPQLWVEHCTELDFLMQRTIAELYPHARSLVKNIIKEDM